MHLFRLSLTDSLTEVLHSTSKSQVVGKVQVPFMLLILIILCSQVLLVPLRLIPLEHQISIWKPQHFKIEMELSLNCEHFVHILRVIPQLVLFL